MKVPGWPSERYHQLQADFDSHFREISRSTEIKKTLLPQRYRFHKRRGSESSRCSHSHPMLRTQPGACFFVPALKSKAAPTAAELKPSSAKRRASKSCFGVPSPTHTMSGSHLLMAASCSASSKAVSSRKGGLCVPTILTFGRRASIFAWSNASVSGVDPKK